MVRKMCQFLLNAHGGGSLPTPSLCLISEQSPPVDIGGLGFVSFQLVNLDLVNFIHFSNQLKLTQNFV